MLFTQSILKINHKVTDKFKLIYPIISDYKCDLSKFSLDKRSSKTLSFKVPSDNYKLVNVNSIHTSYNAMYNFDKIGEKQLCLLTHFFKISKKPTIIYHNKESEILFVFDTLNENTENVNLRNLIVNIVNSIRENINKLHPDAIESSPPYFDGIDNNKFINICLPTFYDTENKQSVTIVPVHFHNSKSKGGNISVIKKEKLTETINEIMTTMPMFKYSKYGQKSEEDDKLLYYEGKCSLSFCVTVKDVKKSDDEKELEKHVHYTIKIYAKEIEIKHNVSYVRSVFDSDLSYINVVKPLDSLSI